MFLASSCCRGVTGALELAYTKLSAGDSAVAAATGSETPLVLYPGFGLVAQQLDLVWACSQWIRSLPNLTLQLSSMYSHKQATLLGVLAVHSVVPGAP